MIVLWLLLVRVRHCYETQILVAVSPRSTVVHLLVLVTRSLTDKHGGLDTMEVIQWIVYSSKKSMLQVCVCPWKLINKTARRNRILSKMSLSGSTHQKGIVWMKARTWNGIRIHLLVVYDTSCRSVPDRDISFRVTWRHPLFICWEGEF